jgi:predicted secreted hydrolase
MDSRRRAWLLALPAIAAAPAHAATDDDDDTVRRGRALVFPRDHGAHPGRRIEWWYATGWLRVGPADALVGFQITFFRSRTSLAAGNPSRFAARQLLFAHAALTDVAGRRHVHADRLARWSGQPTPTLRSRASTTDTDVRLDGWHFARQAADTGRIDAHAQGNGLRMDLQLQPTQPLLLQGEYGWSRKGPQPSQASHYVSQPHLAARGAVEIDGRRLQGEGRAWLDHEWSDEVLHPEAVGWDWIGINLDDGSALTAFVLRRADGSALWAGGSVRPPAGAARSFAPDEVRFEPGRRWRSAATYGDYPVEWSIATPAGTHRVRALLDHQELDGRSSTGTIYWEGLCELLDTQGRRLGLGYLEMTGYAGRLRL